MYVGKPRNQNKIREGVDSVNYFEAKIILNFLKNSAELVVYYWQSGDCRSAVHKGTFGWS